MSKFGRYLNATYMYFIPMCITQPVNKIFFLGDSLRVRAKLRSHDKLHLAAGSNILQGWANLDINLKRGTIRHDLTEPLSVSDLQIEYIYSEHFIEHVSAGDADNLLRECYRALKSGGVLRLSTPDLDYLIEQYQQNNLTEWENVGWLPQSACDMINEGMHMWGHKYLYNLDRLTDRLKAQGFSKIEQVGWRESQHESLRNLECRPFHHEIILEATK